MFRVVPHEFINGDCLLLVIHANVDSQPTLSALRLKRQAKRRLASRSLSGSW